MEFAGESRGPLPHREFPSTTRRQHRPRLLYACGLSLLRIAHKSYKKAEELHGPIGSIAQKLASFASPLAYTLQYQWLSILSFADEQILTVEHTVETLFPPSKHLFDRIDILLDISEILPRKFDDVVDHFPAVIHQVPLIGWVATQLMVGLYFLQSIVYWIFDGEKEVREIVVDVNCDERYVGSTPEVELGGVEEIGKKEEGKGEKMGKKDVRCTPGEELGGVEEIGKKEEDKRREKIGKKDVISTREEKLVGVQEIGRKEEERKREKIGKKDVRSKQEEKLVGVEEIGKQEEEGKRDVIGKKEEERKKEKIGKMEEEGKTQQIGKGVGSTPEEKLGAVEKIGKKEEGKREKIGKEEGGKREDIGKKEEGKGIRKKRTAHIGRIQAPSEVATIGEVRDRPEASISFVRLLPETRRGRKEKKVVLKEEDPILGLFEAGWHM
ncbi:uncharacterized protein LOC143891415 [Tasmannia lanceolata]|uniref:uncharacterized protein LOC143891415 n=1 Tax=Tasmannia lanceolata TaxID=3420 RepID=UPI004062848C